MLNADTWYWEQELHDVEPPPFLIDGVIPARSVNMLFGEFNLGKTFLALDWAASIATGKPWVGRETVQGDVLYVASEGDPGNLGLRTEAWRATHLDEPLRILFYTDTVDLLASVDELLSTAVAHGVRPRMVIIDTLAMAMVEGENDNDKMNALIRALRKHQEYADPETGDILDIAWVLVHHVGWTDKNRPRGGSGMPGGLDYVVGLKEGPSETIEVFHYKAKNSAKFLPMLFKQVEVEDSLVYEYVPVEEAKRMKVMDKDTGRADIEAHFDDWLQVWPDGAEFNQATFRKARDIPDDHKSTVSRVFADATERGDIEQLSARKWRKA